MQDRYLFRGKRIDNSAWETGFLVIERFNCSDSEHFITDKMTGYHTPVDPATVGQCTGMRDKNGDYIFEGDIVVAECWKERFSVFWGFYGWHLNMPDLCESLYDYEYNDFEIIGNIYDNPELLKVEGLS